MIYTYITVILLSLICNGYGLEIIQENKLLEVWNIKAIQKFNVESLVKSYGYSFEKHTVTTSDGYVLELHRIPSSQKDGNTNEARPPVLIMHGIFGSSADFLHLGVNKALPLRLVDQGYDVWLGNNRGNTFSRKHTTLHPDADSDFWDFSWHEVGRNDTTAIIDYILNETKATTLSYIGFSTGATQFFIMASNNTEYNKKVNVMVALAPHVYIGNASDRMDLELYKQLQAFEKQENMTSVLEHDEKLDIILKMICDNTLFQKICTLFLYLVQGFDSDGLDRTILPQFFKAFPAGSSVRELNHFFQFQISADFRQYDYGKLDNFKYYKNITPPAYNLKAVKVPVSILYGANDLIVVEQDVEKLTKVLPNATNMKLPDPKFNELDFLLGKNEDRFANYYIINILNSYNNKDALSSNPASSGTTDAPSPNSTTGTPENNAGSTISLSFIVVSMDLICATYLFIRMF